MITLIHGQNTIASRQFLVELIEKEKKDGQVLVRFEKDDQTVSRATQLLAGENLFGQKTTLLLENYLKGKSDKSLDFESHLKKINASIIIWEDDQRPVSSLSRFPGARVLEFKLTSSVFKLLDGLSPASPESNLQLFHQSLKTAAPEMIFVMLAKRFVDLLSPPSKLAEWQKARLLAQSKHFPQTKLKEVIKNLLAIDLLQKTSSSPLSLEGELELFLIKL